MNFKGRESTTPQKFCSSFFVENIIIFVKKCNCVWKKHKILATGLRAATWRRRTWRGRRKSTGSRRTGTRRGQGEQEKQDRGEKYSEEEYSDEKGTVRSRKTGTGRRKSEVRRRLTVIGRRKRGGGLCREGE